MIDMLIGGYKNNSKRWMIAFFMFFFINNLVEFAQKYDVEIATKDLEELQEFLKKHPMLGTKHFIGERLYKAISLHKNAGGGFVLEKTNPQNANTFLFRGRNRNFDTNVCYTKDEMWTPKPGYSSHGRYNAIGIPVLYLSDKKEALPYEIHTADNEIIDIAKFRVERDLILFDISLFGSECEKYFNDATMESRQLKHSYLLPNFFAACCYYLGYDGIKYSGVREINMNYINYALFNFVDSIDVSIIDSPVSYKQITVRHLETL